MAQLIVTVKRLNKRTTVPAVLPDPSSIIGVVEEGFQFQGEAVSPEEILNPAMGTWYRDRDGYVYWGGGLAPAEMPSLLEAAAAEVPFSWWMQNRVYDIPAIWKQLPEGEIGIAILDSGISTHIDFDFNRINGYNYLENSDAYKTDPYGHGTHLAGVIAAQGQKSFGIIPKANLFIAKVTDNQGQPNGNAIEMALRDILSGARGTDRVEIINMSFHYQGANSAVITDLIHRLVNDKQIIIVAACGDEDWVFDSFPARLDVCISTGGIGTDYRRWPFSTKSTTLDIMAPGASILSSKGKDAVVNMDGTSQSAAFISGLCGLGLLHMKKNGPKNIETLKKVLFQTALNSAFPLVEYGHGIANPNAFVESIKSI